MPALITFPSSFGIPIIAKISRQLNNTLYRFNGNPFTRVHEVDEVILIEEGKIE